MRTASTANHSQVLLSIIIVHYNTPEMTKDCLKSIEKFLPHFPVEVIVVDNASSQTVEEHILNSFPFVKYIRTGSNLGFSKANNLGIQNSHGEFIFLLNSDTKIIEPIFQPMVDYLRANETVGVVGPRLVDAEGQFQLSCGFFPTFLSEVIRKIWHLRLSVNDYPLRSDLDEKFSSMTQIDWVTGAALMVRRSALKNAGLLDERFFMYFEDIDFCRRIENAGWEIHFLSDVKLIHYIGQSAKKNLMKVQTEYRRSQLYFAKKYYGWAGRFLMGMMLFMKYLIPFLISLLQFAWSRISGKGIRTTFSRALLLKKVIFIAFESISSEALEPHLISARIGETITAS